MAITEPVQQALSVPLVEVPGICQATAKTHFKLKVTGEAAAKALKGIERVLCNT